MEKHQTVSFRLEASTVEELDEIAERLDRHRTFVLKQAIQTFIELHQWQIKHIQEGLAEADRSDFAEPDEVEVALNDWG